MNSTHSSDRIGAAYHEAGHTIVAWALGLPVGDIAIAVGGDDAAGRSQIGVADQLAIPANCETESFGNKSQDAG
jgi:hypothetical protein